MAIIDMKRGDSNIVRAYRGTELIFERGEPYIAVNANRYERDCYIPVTDLGELHGDWTYEVDWTTSTTIWDFCVLIGGTYASVTPISAKRFKGLFVGIYGGRNHNDPHEGIGLWSQSGTNNNVWGYYPWNPSTARHITTMTVSDEIKAESDYREIATNGGFALFGCLDGESQTVQTIDYEAGTNISCWKATPIETTEDRIYRISIYDTNNNLIMNFLPKIENGHKGMIETISGNFYPAYDDQYFEIGRG